MEMVEEIRVSRDKTVEIRFREMPLGAQACSTKERLRHTQAQPPEAKVRT